MQTLWQLRSPFSGQVTACRLLQHPQNYELLIVGLTDGLPAASYKFADTNGAMTSAETLSRTLRGLGWSEASEEEAVS